MALANMVHCIYLAVISLIIGQTMGQDTASTPTCIDELTNYGKCIRNATDSILRDSAPFNAQVERCLKTFKCGKADSGNQTDAPPAAAGQFAIVPASRFLTCALNLTGYFRTEVEQCIKNRIPDWDDTTKQQQEKVANLFRQPSNYVTEIKARAAELCPNDPAGKSAKICVDLAVKRTKLPTSSDAADALSKMCKANSDCRNQLSAGCKTRLDEIRAAACTCVQDYLTPASDRFFGCLDNTIINGVRTTLKLDGGPYFTGPAMKKFCNSFDPCTLNVTNVVPIATQAAQTITNMLG